LRDENQQHKEKLQSREAQVQNDLAAVRLENKQLKRKHYIDATDKLELVDLRQEKKHFQQNLEEAVHLRIGLAAKSQETKQLRIDLTRLEKELQSRLAEKDDLSKDQQKLLVELEEVKRDEYALKANHAMEVTLTETFRAASSAMIHLQTELKSTKNTIQSLDTQIEMMRSQLQNAKDTRQQHAEMSRGTVRERITEPPTIPSSSVFDDHQGTHDHDSTRQAKGKHEENRPVDQESIPTRAPEMKHNIKSEQRQDSP
jgi:chromosome segregation ATPase